MIYLIMTMTSVFLAVIHISYKDRYALSNREGDYRKSLIAAVLSVLPFIIVAGFRYDVGTDYLYTYVTKFNEIANGQENYFEPGFYLLNKLIQLYTRDYFWLFLVCAVITYAIVFNCIFRYLNDPAFGILLFVITTGYFVSLNTTRQYIAIALFLWSIRYIRSGEWWKYLITIVIGAMFHTSILIMLPLYFLCRMRFRPVVSFATIGVAFAVTSLLRNLLTSLFANQRYGEYFDSYYDSGETAVRFLLINLAILILGLICMKIGGNEETTEAIPGKPEEKEAEESKPYQCDDLNIYMQIQFVSTVVCACSGAIPLAYRIIWNFSSIQIFLIPIMLERIQNAWARNLAKGAVIASFTALTIVTIFMNGEHGVVPYHSIFSK